MRYTVQFQQTTGQWVIFDTQTFTMLGTYRSEEAALIGALAIEEKSRQRHSQTRTSMRVA
jgi:hypothetical protein